MGQEAPGTAAKEKVDSSGPQRQGPPRVYSEGLAEPQRPAGVPQDSEQMVGAIKELLPPAFGDRAGLLIRLIDYLEEAPTEEFETIQNLMDSLSEGSEEIRHHLINQLKLIKPFADLGKKEVIKDGAPKRGTAEPGEEAEGDQAKQKRTAL